MLDGCVLGSHPTVPSLTRRSAALTLQWSGPARAFGTSPGRSPKGYLPSVSIFFFSSSFIFLTVGLWLLSPVV